MTSGPGDGARGPRGADGPRGAPGGGSIGTGSLRLTVPGTYEAIASARTSLARWLEKSGVKPRIVSEMALVLTEICNNAVEHGSADASKPISLEADLAGDDACFEVIEGSCASVNPVVEGFLAASTPPDQASERGRGFFLIRAYVDDLQVDSTASGCMRIRFRKRIPR